MEQWYDFKMSALNNVQWTSMIIMSYYVIIEYRVASGRTKVVRAITMFPLDFITYAIKVISTGPPPRI